MIGVLLFILAMFEGFFGYSPARRPAVRNRRPRGPVVDHPGPALVGTWMHWAIFGGDFPGNIIIPRLYAVHILIFPGIMLALIGVHLALVWFQKHTQFPAPAAPRPTSSVCVSCRCSR